MESNANMAIEAIESLDEVAELSRWIESMAILLVVVVAILVDAALFLVCRKTTMTTKAQTVAVVSNGSLFLLAATAGTTPILVFAGSIVVSICRIFLCRLFLVFPIQFFKVHSILESSIGIFHSLESQFASKQASSFPFSIGFIHARWPFRKYHCLVLADFFFEAIPLRWLSDPDVCLGQLVKFLVGLKVARGTIFDHLTIVFIPGIIGKLIIVIALLLAQSNAPQFGNFLHDCE